MSSIAADAVVIGAGVIGLAIARHLALAGREVLVLESNNSFGMETSSRNSGVIHAGIYYPPASLKSRSCVRGKQLLYDYCECTHVPFDRCGKLIIASNDDQEIQLRELQLNAITAGVDDLEWLDLEQVQQVEPDIKASAALLSPSTGIVDTHALMLALLADIENAGGTLVTRSRVMGGKIGSNRLELRVDDGSEYVFSANAVVNAAGHGAAKIARNISGLPVQTIPAVYPVRGHYYEHAGKLPFSRLIYPLPDTTGLGIHVTIDIAGQYRFGPDAEYCDTIDYHFDETGRSRFAEAIERWYPALNESHLRPGYVGIRPGLQAPGQDRRDFMISGPDQHGVSGMINLFGMDSPGLTACIAIAEEVASRL